MAHADQHPVEPAGRVRAVCLPITCNPSKKKPVNQHAIDQLRRCVLGDHDLQERLRVISNHDDFVRAVLELAREHGLDLTVYELEAEMKNAQQAWLLRWL